MYAKKLLIIIIGCFLFFESIAQVKESLEEVDAHSLNLYNAGQWQVLMNYGKEKISSGIDFPLLRMRTGYAAFMLENYSLSLLQYEKVFNDDADNKLALHYVYLNNLYLNNITAARFYAAQLAPETKVSEKIESVKIASLESEYSYKMPSDTTRNNAQYARIGLNIHLGYKLELQQSVAMYNQLISELKINPPPIPPPPPNTTIVQNPQHINIQQKEYYGKLIFAASGRVSLIGGFHYLYTPFNNLIYNNNIVFAGIKYTSPYVHLSAMAHFGNITDSAFNQYEASVSLFPLGNTKLYTVSKVADGDNVIFSQVVGFAVTKTVWLEGNVTLGKFYKLLEHDALYVYNDIDQKKFKAGGSIYALLSKKLLLTLNYSFEQKALYKTTNNNFYQNSITGGLTWKF